MVLIHWLIYLIEKYVWEPTRHSSRYWRNGEKTGRFWSCCHEAQVGEENEQYQMVIDTGEWNSHETGVCRDGIGWVSRSKGWGRCDLDMPERQKDACIWNQKWRRTVQSEKAGMATESRIRHFTLIAVGHLGQEVND